MHKRSRGKVEAAVASRSGPSRLPVAVHLTMAGARHPYSR
jgi:hypothetical protein